LFPDVRSFTSAEERTFTEAIQITEASRN